MRIKAVVFDFDGTLADTLPVCFYAFRRLFSEIDRRELTDDEIVGMFGPSETGIIQENLANQAAAEAAIAQFYQHYDAMHDELVTPNPDIQRLLMRLRGEGIGLGVVTGKARRSLDISMRKLGMDNVFDIIVTGDDVELPKPHPEGIFKALAALGSQPDEALFIGDSHADIKAGKAAGVLTIGVHWLPTVQSQAFEPQPDYLFRSTRELEALLALKQD
ncbi:HAD family hydrolase [Paenibacillus sp. R14(2021)]|uniref:HAD family hydrolase n=1 Tax=Paenibacillus sp. R14(2021) TaxID=2859228 RepID=UPI001C613301|nr:HAD-IA family hydrolase [Paenibacillus sp. R14(2021)]